MLEELKARAAESGKSLREALEETLRLGLGVTRGGRPKRRFRVQAHPLGLKAGFHGMSMNQLFDQLEAETDLAEPGRCGSQQSQRVAEDPR